MALIYLFGVLIFILLAPARVSSHITKSTCDNEFVDTGNRIYILLE